MIPTSIAETPRSEEIRAIVDLRLREARKAGGAPETVRIEWRGQPVNLEVVTMPVDDLYYNPETHRIRAQRSHDPRRDTELDEAPWSPESQAYLHFLITSRPDNPDTRDPDFEKLKEDLYLHGQKDAGIITPTGLVVNGNTRLAALRDLTASNIRVAVLPADATWGDITAVELELQLRKDRRRHYSYINRLIAINEQISNGRSVKEIAKSFRTTLKSIERDQWIYHFICDAIERSRTELANGDTASLRLLDFEGHQETLAELYRNCQAAVSADDADVLKESRLLAILLDFAKTDIRHINEDFHDSYLAPRLNDEFSAPAAPDEGRLELPGFAPGPGLEVAGEAPRVLRTRAATDRVLSAKARESVSVRLSQEETAETAELLMQARDAMKHSVSASKANALRAQRKDAAAEALREATASVRDCTRQVAQARSQDLLELRALDKSLEELSAALAQLARHASRGVDNPGPGLSWLQNAVSEL
jgi:hypothetical protein